MNDERTLMQGRLPGRLTVPQVALLLGFGEADIPLLVRARLLKPLGLPSPNSVKYFARTLVERLADDETFLDRATRVVGQYWRKKHDPQRKQPRGPAGPRLAAVDFPTPILNGVGSSSQKSNTA